MTNYKQPIMHFTPSSMETQTPCAKLSPPPWEVLVLVAHHLDPKTLAMASCVSKSWSHSMSSDHVWKPILATHFPCLSALPPAVPYRRLFALGHSTAKSRRKNPSKPNISLSDLLFVVSIISTLDSHVITSVSKPGDALLVDSAGVFHFSIGDCDGGEMEKKSEGFEEVNVTWNVVLKGWRGVFTMMDCKGKVGLVPGGQGWFSQELPVPGCCSKAVASSVVADLKVGVCSGEGSSDENGKVFLDKPNESGKVRVDKVSVGILNVVDWRYIGVEDGLRYLQHFLPTFNA